MGKDKNYSLNIHHRRVEIDKAFYKNPKPLGAGHFYLGLAENGKVSFFPNYPKKGSFLRDLINGEEIYDALQKVYHDVTNIEENELVQWITTKTIKLTPEQFTQAYEYAVTHQASTTEKSYDGGFKSAAFIQSVYHEAGLPLHFTAIYTRSELRDLGTSAATKVLIQYGSRDTFEKHFSKISAPNEIELASRLNIPKNTIIPNGDYNFFSILVPEINLPLNYQPLIPALKNPNEVKEIMEIHEELRKLLCDSLKTHLPYRSPIIAVEKNHWPDIIHCSLLYMTKQFISKGPDVVATPEFQQWAKEIMSTKVYNNITLYLNSTKFNEFIKLDEIANRMSANLSQCSEEFFKLLVTTHKIFYEKWKLEAPPKDTVSSKIKKFFSKKSTELLSATSETQEFEDQLTISYKSTIKELIEKFHKVRIAIDYELNRSIDHLVNNFNFLDLVARGQFPNYYNPELLCNKTTEQLIEFSQTLIPDLDVSDQVVGLGELL